MHFSLKLVALALCVIVDNFYANALFSQGPPPEASFKEQASWSSLAPYTLALSGSRASPQSHKFFRFSTFGANSIFQQPITAINLGRTWNTKVSWGGQLLNLVFDTGSSDTWVVDDRFRCFDFLGLTQPTHECAFGPVYNRSLTFKELSNIKFHIRYGDGEWADGVFGLETISLAGLAATCQVAVVERAHWMGDHISSGLLGFGLQGLTSQVNQNGSTSTYQPVFSRLSGANRIDPIFSVALGRTAQLSEDTGLLALGGLPNVTIEGSWISLPFQLLSLNRSNVINMKDNDYTFYSVQVDDVGIGYSSSLSIRSSISHDDRSIQWFRHSSHLSRMEGKEVFRRDEFPSLISAIVDTGTTLNFFPRQVAEFVGLNACTHRAEYAPGLGVYLLPCDAVCRPLAVRMGDGILLMDPQDVLLRQGPFCYLGVTVSQSLNILGGTFLKNVVVVFDQGTTKIRFAQRAEY